MIQHDIAPKQLTSIPPIYQPASQGVNMEHIKTDRERILLAFGHGCFVGAFLVICLVSHLFGEIQSSAIKSGAAYWSINVYGMATFTWRHEEEYSIQPELTHTEITERLDRD